MTSENTIFNLAEDFVRNTSRLVFLTGKAGTGKTTFLKHIKETTTKKAVVVAPTGVAAINARGVTIHSFFQLPFTPFVPEMEKGSERSPDMADRYALLKNIKIDSDKRRLFKELELLIIDEVSMVRCDVLDAIDTTLRHFRRKPFVPFGGVQVLFIGDLFQLPPVVPDDQWEILKHYYGGPFFFDAYVLRHTRPLYLELKTIYRQKDARFITLLNNIRNNRVGDGDMELLNDRYHPDFESGPEEHYVTITTHNYKADAINMGALSVLPAPLFQFDGEITGDFPSRNFPTDKVLRLKEGAQIMFIKNDAEKVRRYYNGKIGRISRIEPEKIVVVFPDEPEELEVTKDTWVNIRYTLNPQTHQVEEEVLGTFTQYAIRLAWAITIHKSQGLTFERVIIDAGNAFAAGQVYVALSRCTSLHGVVLRSKIFRERIMTDERVIRFAGEESSPDQLAPILEAEKKLFLMNSLLEIFDWSTTIDELEKFLESLEKKKFHDKQQAVNLILSLLEAARDQHLHAQKFQEQLRKMASSESGLHLMMQQRVTSASVYFTTQLDDSFLFPLKEHQAEIRGMTRVKTYLKELKTLIGFLKDQRVRMADAPALLPQKAVC